MTISVNMVNTSVGDEHINTRAVAGNVPIKEESPKLSPEALRAFLRENQLKVKALSPLFKNSKIRYTEASISWYSEMVGNNSFYESIAVIIIISIDLHKSVLAQMLNR